MAKIIRNTRLILLRRYASSIKFIMMAAAIAFITVFLPKQARFRYEYEKGKVWMHDDLVSPYSYAIKKPQAQLEKDRKEVLRSILPVYQNKVEVPKNVINNFDADFETRWNATGLPERLKDDYEDKGIQVINAVYDKGLLTPDARYPDGKQVYNFLLLTNNISRELNTQAVFTPETAQAFISEQISSQPALKNSGWLISLVQSHLQPNYIFDERLTAEIEQEAISNISTAHGMVQKGELIVSNGTLINEDIYQKLESLRIAYEDDSRAVGDRRLVFAGRLFMVGLVIALLMVFLYLFRKDIFRDNRQLSVILIVVTFMLLCLSWAIRVRLPSIYYIPYCAVPIIIRILFDTRLALNIHLLVVLIGGFFVPNSFEFAFLQITSGMVAIYSIKNFVKREQFLISALLILGNYFVAYLGISLIRSGSIYEVEWQNFVPFILSVLLSLLAYPLIYAFERMFGITSDISLMELTNTNSRLLRDLAFKAPGTFQHSLQVANLAEAAIFKIGGNSLLVRAGALYHDIGKMDRPEYFIENQNKGVNPHDSLSYEQSAQIIIQHVHKGVELAKKNNLPQLIIDFIRTHHGNTRVDYFYQSFLKNFPEKIVDENTFRYPGPIPFTKETSVLMLADSVEAASRSLKEPNVKSISDLVDRIIDYKLEQNQLINSSITLKDIETIRLIFKTMLMSIYHVRIEYELQR
ncbi:MAG TPA: HDIG domain-containing protein [Sphingobacteriaceae bacterium]